MKPPVATQVQYAARDIKTPSKPNQIALVAHDVSFVINISLFDGILMRFALHFTLGRGFANLLRLVSGLR
jgi:hypothetical protein